MHKHKKQPRRHSLIVAVSIFLVSSFFITGAITKGASNREKRRQIEDLRRQVAIVNQKNAELKKVASSGGAEEKAYMERLARERLGYAMPDEKIYRNGNPENS